MKLNLIILNILVFCCFFVNNANATIILGPANPTALTAVDDNGLVGLTNLAGTPSSGNSFTIATRSRGNETQDTLQFVTIADFNVSSLTAADVNDPNFVAELNFDYVGHLNNTQPNILSQVGQVTSNAAPDFDLGFDDDDAGNQANAMVVASNVTVLNLNGSTNTSAAINDLSLGTVAAQTVDVTPIIQDWVLNPTNNNGIVFFLGNVLNSSQGAYFDNLTLTASIIPEPASILLVGSLLSLIFGCHRRKRVATA